MPKTPPLTKGTLAGLAFIWVNTALLYGATVPDLLQRTLVPAVGGEIASKVSGAVPQPLPLLARLLGIAALPPRAPIIDTVPASDRVSAQMSAEMVRALYRDLGYGLYDVIRDDQPVPRVFLASIPDDLSVLRDSAFRKSLFLRTLLPLILRVNEEITADRERVEVILQQKKTTGHFRAYEQHWLDGKVREYGLAPGEYKALLTRLDVVPPSLALAQAAEESGWGTSRFARTGNALFGQWTWNRSKGMTPQDAAPGTSHAVKSFPSLLLAVKAYAHNLNTHRAYAPFRQERAAVRERGEAVRGYTLANTLHRYSERGTAYVDTLHDLMRGNNLPALDDARLSSTPLEMASLEERPQPTKR
ncbi:glucosaminidase domain-containing protein [Insolitispirillum peregrinum]|uniref:Bax protein n=1 Tax=Insolitispirillum peregrinum TaxID=80876 RepID=A0A1N7KD88_9PROT|nr:glucosaminidase domain-containing protein [Insolitispirillum peregrinum]SIS59519.1 Bax protein [Insolitispirillum peregrinum]